MTGCGRTLIACVLLSLCSPASAHAPDSPTRARRREFAPVKRHHSRPPLSVIQLPARSVSPWKGRSCCGAASRVAAATGSN
jgi:hypothetical protein